jgi:AcrR family transcriptional regulator
VPAATPHHSELANSPVTIWNRPDRGARGPQPEHSRAQIAAAAVLLADAGGLSAVSMRAVASALTTTAGSLYRYLSSRDELLELMVDAVLAELRLGQDSTGAWLDDMMALAEDQLAVYQRHPWLLEATLNGGVMGPNATGFFEACLRILAPLHCGTARKLEAIAMMSGVVSLFARAAGTGGARPTSNPFALASADVHPYLTAAIGKATPAETQDDLFGRTTRSVLRGLLGENS